MDREGGSDLFPMIAPPALPTFDLALRGYDRRQVDEYLDRVEHDLSVAQADRDAASTRIALLEKRLDELENELQAARHQLAEGARPTYAGLGRRVEQLLSIAEEEAERLRADALRDTAEERAAAGGLVQEAQKDADLASREFEAALELRRREAEQREAADRAKLDKQLTAAEKRIGDAEAAADARIAEAEDAAKTRIANARAESDRLVGEATDRSERLRKDAEQHATALVQAARHDVERIELEARSHAETIIAEARAEAEQGRIEHDREIAKLLRRRQDIHHQLTTLRHVLGTLPEAAGDEDDDLTLVTPTEETPDRPPGQAPPGGSSSPESPRETSGQRPPSAATAGQGPARKSPPAPTAPAETPVAKAPADETAPPGQAPRGQSPRNNQPRTSTSLRKTGS